MQTTVSALRDRPPANGVRRGELDIPLFPYLVGRAPAPARRVALHYRKASDSAPEIVEVRDVRRGELLTADSRRGVYSWLQLHGYRWCTGMDGVWEAPQSWASQRGAA